MLPMLLWGGNGVVMSSGPPTLRWNSDSCVNVWPRTVTVGPGSWLALPRPPGVWPALAETPTRTDATTTQAGRPDAFITVPPMRVAYTTRLQEDAVLHKTSQLRGYHIVATDGEIGHVDDFLIDGGNWTLRYLVVDTSNWIGGRSVLISP